MATDTNDKVQDGADVHDIDFNEVAANLGFTPQAKPAAEEKAKDDTTEPDEKADETDKAQAEPAETEDDKPAAEESEETAEEDAEEESKEEKAEDGEAKPESEDQEPNKVQRRIDKLTAEKHELREQLDAIKAQLEQTQAQAEAKPPVIYKDSDNPLSSFTDAAALEAEIAKAQAVLDWTDDHRDGGTVTVGGEEKYYDADAVKQIRANARGIVKAGPKQQEYLRIREATLPEAKAAYPGFFTPGTAEHQALQATLKQYPSLAQYPNLELIVGDAFAGQQLRLARLEQLNKKRSAADATKKAPAKSAETAKVPKAPVPNASPKVTNSSGAALRQKAEAALKAKGDNREALSAFLEEIV